MHKKIILLFEIMNSSNLVFNRDQEKFVSRFLLPELPEFTIYQKLESLQGTAGKNESISQVLTLEAL